jgi:hypothetical protein
MQKHVKRIGFWGTVAAALAAFTVVYLYFRVRTALKSKDE